MRFAVDFQNERLDLEVPDDRPVAEWHGPAGVSGPDAEARVAEALEGAREYPPLRQVVVPGDRVIVATDGTIPGLEPVLAAVCETLGRAGVDPGSITVVAATSAREEVARALPDGVASAFHDPDDRDRIAYLASTNGGRRVYLNQLLTDADVVLPVGRLGYDPALGYGGPWGVIFPGLSDRETQRAFRGMATADWPDRDRDRVRPALVESAEVSWLLGTQFHLGIVPGTSGLAGAIAGLESAVRAGGSAALDQAWTFEAEGRAELVVAGVGRPGVPGTIDDLAAALTNASRLVERGGKVVVLSRARGPIGPALRRLIDLDDPRLAPAALRGHESDPDHDAARQIARALAWADVYLLSSLDPEALVDSPLIALDRPEEARRLVDASRSCIVFSQAESVRARVAGETP